MPFAESVGTLRELQDAGKINHVGVPNVSLTELAAAREIVDVLSVQNSYSLGDREHEELLKVCEHDGLAFIPCYPLGGGDLVRSAGPLDRVVTRHRASRSQVAIAWLLSLSSRVLPIPGTSSVGHLEENMRAADLSLEPQDLAELADA